MKVIANLIFLVFSYTSSQVFAQSCKASRSSSDLVAANTFMIIPINAFASPIPENIARDFYNKNCSLKTLPLSEKMNCAILKDCKGEMCLKTYSSHGTAFLLGNGHTLVTAWHVVFQTHAAPLLLFADRISVMDSVEKNRVYQNLKPEFILVNQENNIVYDTREQQNKATRYVEYSDPISTVYSERGKKNDNPFGYYENISTEQAVIELQQDIGTGLQLSKQDIQGQCIHSAGFGYDGHTLNFALVSGQKSSLLSLNQSLGVFMDFQLKRLEMSRKEIEKLSTFKILVLMGYLKKAAYKQLRQFSELQLREAIQVILDTQARHERDLDISQNEKSLYFTAPVLSGFSGAPVFTDAGEVIAVTTNAFLKSDEKTSRQASVGGAALLLSND